MAENESANESKTTRNVLIAIDGSEESEYAFEFYVKNFHQPGNQLLVVHGVELPPLTRSVGFDPRKVEQRRQPSPQRPNAHLVESAEMRQAVYDNLLDMEKKKVKNWEEGYAQKMRSHNLKGKIRAVFCGRPGHLVVETAREEKVSMIVMGTRGLDVLSRTILGSVSDYVLHHAQCPVIICRRPQPLVER